MNFEKTLLGQSELFQKLAYECDRRRNVKPHVADQLYFLCQDWFNYTSTKTSYRRRIGFQNLTSASSKRTQLCKGIMFQSWHCVEEYVGCQSEHTALSRLHSQHSQRYRRTMI